jgi:hypothetical protein
MPPLSGKKKYRKGYTEDDLQEAVNMVKQGSSFRVACSTYNIPKTTLIDRVNETHSGVQGRPTVLSPEEEKIIIEMVELLSVWGFPFTQDDLRFFVKSYLDKKGVKTRFADNLPTRRFVDTFLGRHSEFTLRKTNAIKRSRAALSREEVTKFFDNFAKSAEGVAAENMYNFDETNLRDDPGNRKCLFKKGTKYCEKVQNTSKQAKSTFSKIFLFIGSTVLVSVRIDTVQFST